jgi:flagellar biosynthesis protein FlhG
MRDQAESLRVLTAHTRRRILSERGNPLCHVYAVTSGKGGVGKSMFSLNLAIALSLQEERVLLFDADLGLPNLDIMLGLTPAFTLQHYLLHRVPLQDILVKGPAGISILSGGSGVYELANLGEREVLRILQDMKKLEFAYDRIIFDTAAGISSQVIKFAAAADEVFLIIVAEPTSIVDAYSTLKLIWHEMPETQVRVIVNQANSKKEASDAFEALARVAHRYLHRELTLLGTIPDDMEVENAVKSQVPVVIKSPKSAAGSRIRQIAAAIVQGDGTARSRGSFFDRVFPAIVRR